MKPSITLQKDAVMKPHSSHLLDGCSVCTLIKKSILEGYEFTIEEWEKAFEEAGEQLESV